jgi:hypothetical protein
MCDAFSHREETKMNSIETIDLEIVAGENLPRYVPQRARDGEPAGSYGSAFGGNRPLCVSPGISSSHYLRRVAGDKATAASSAAAMLAATPAPVERPRAPEISRNLSQSTSELRRRILLTFVSRPRAPLSVRASWLMIVGAAMLLWFGIDGVILAL